MWAPPPGPGSPATASLATLPCGPGVSGGRDVYGHATDAAAGAAAGGGRVTAGGGTRILAQGIPLRQQHPTPYTHTPCPTPPLPCNPCLPTADINVEHPQDTTLMFDPFPPPKNLSIFPSNYTLNNVTVKVAKGMGSRPTSNPLAVAPHAPPPPPPSPPASPPSPPSPPPISQQPDVIVYNETDVAVVFNSANGVNVGARLWMGCGWSGLRIVPGMPACLCMAQPAHKQLSFGVGHSNPAVVLPCFPSPSLAPCCCRAAGDWRRGPHGPHREVPQRPGAAALPAVVHNHRGPVHRLGRQVHLGCQEGGAPAVHHHSQRRRPHEGGRVYVAAGGGARDLQTCPVGSLAPAAPCPASRSAPAAAQPRPRPSSGFCLHRGCAHQPALQSPHSPWFKPSQVHGTATYWPSCPSLSRPIPTPNCFCRYKQVTIKNMRFLNGNSSGLPGGLISVQGSVDITFDNCEFGQSTGGWVVGVGGAEALGEPVSVGVGIGRRGGHSSGGGQGAGGALGLGAAGAVGSWQCWEMAVRGVCCPRPTSRHSTVHSPPNHQPTTPVLRRWRRRRGERRQQRHR